MLFHLKSKNLLTTLRTFCSRHFVRVAPELRFFSSAPEISTSALRFASGDVCPRGVCSASPCKKKWLVESFGTLMNGAATVACLVNAGILFWLILNFVVSVRHFPCTPQYGVVAFISLWTASFPVFGWHVYWKAGALKANLHFFCVLSQWLRCFNINYEDNHNLC